MRLIGYVRRSDASKQGDNGSQEQQIARLKGWCNLYGHELIGEPRCEDLSGKTVHRRPVFKQALAEILKQDKADGLLIMKLDRFSRDEADAHLIKRAFDKAGKAIICTDEPINTAEPHGDIIFGLLVSLAAAEHKTIVGRFQRGIKHAKAQGRDLTPVPRYGWRREGRGKDSVIVEDEAEQEVLAIILNMSKNYSDGAIVGFLNRCNRKTRHGKAWSVTQVARIRQTDAAALDSSL